MSDLTPEDRARALEMENVWVAAGGLGRRDEGLTLGTARAWLAVEAHALATHECPTVPVWRPTTCDEIQPGWEVRSRRGNGSEAVWGVAYRQNRSGNWFTEGDTLLTWDDMSWTYETTAPEPDPRIRVVVEWSNEPAASTRAEAAVDLLARLDALTGGERS